ncbi:hypothetical protein [Candidatus Methanodesulfokora washburnensis]|jgi:hypothetical protein|uniref:Uncharacterized protein n=1 Tax=Candidatus Methanodesulfokora washburnensis TaxID=2478471 RepID=A0A3R9QU29_9CREN|nr:hypothetical protein [Candidatus Methanodesulfokores washburnensis]RSN71903.1 hypothetical protein D6D85_15060 [Candidatus Methanodesulfokores washburnensis]
MFSLDVIFLMLYDTFLTDDIARHFALPSEKDGINQTSDALRPTNRSIKRIRIRIRYLNKAGSPP